MRDEAGPGLSSSLIPHPFPPEHLTPSFTLFSGEATGAAASVRLQFGAGEAAMNRHPYLTGLAVIALVAGRALPAAGRLPVLWPTISGYAAHPAAPGTRPPGAPIASAAAGSQLLILGANLGTSGTLAFNGIPALPALSWSPNEILVTVPAAPSYPFRGPVTVTVDGRTGTGPEFTIIQPPPPPGPLRDYTIQPIVKLGDVVGDSEMQIGGPFQVGTLNDNGQLAFIAGNAAGA